MIRTEKAFKHFRAWLCQYSPKDRLWFCVPLVALTLFLLCLSLVYPFFGVLLFLAACTWFYSDIDYTQQQRKNNELFLQRATVGVSECLFSLVSSLHNILGVVPPFNAASMVADIPLVYHDNIPMVRIMLQKVYNRTNNDYDIMDMLNRGIASMAKIGRIAGLPRNTTAKNRPTITIAYITEDTAHIFLDIALLDYPGTIQHLRQCLAKSNTPKKVTSVPTSHDFD